MSTPATDRLKRKAALKEARQQLALRKKQREELRAQRAARLGGKLEVSSSPIKRQASLTKQPSLLLAFLDDDDDIKDDPVSSSFSTNKMSLVREPGTKRSLAIGRMKHYNFTPVSNVETRHKATDTHFDMFCQNLKEEFHEEFKGRDEVKANLMESKYKMGWPREAWMHEKSLSPAPQSLIYEDDDYIEQEKKIERIQKQEKERKQRQSDRIKQRRKVRLERKNRNILPNKEADLLINTGGFIDHFRQKTKWMERTLGINNTLHSHKDSDNSEDEDTDVSMADNDEIPRLEDRSSLFISNKRKKLKRKALLKYSNNKFYSAETQKRAICDINFSATNSDWFLASYFTEDVDRASLDNDGLVLIWNLLLPRFPEYKLYSESQITSTHFHPMDKFLVFAATTSGQILCYDLRTGSNSKPVQRTNFNDAHSSAIYCMDFLHSVGDKQRRHLLSLSNDGKLCIFKDNGLNVEAMHHGMLTLKNVQNVASVAGSSSAPTSASASASSQELSTVCFGYPHKRSDNILFGSDSGKVYRTDIHNKHSGSDDKIYVEQCVDAHSGPITNIHFPSGNVRTQKTIYDKSTDKEKISTSTTQIPSSISALYLTSSYDWTVKLWHCDYVQQIETYTSMTDYVYDVKWCNGGKYGVFAACDGAHKLTLFDLKYDFKEPLNVINVPTEDSSAALTKLNWAKNGKYLCCGDSNGTIYMYISSTSLLNPQQNDIDNLDKAVKKSIDRLIKSGQLTKQPK
eukprot:45433_1